jgi:hypothetical protein
MGHEAYSCDVQECSGGHPEWHIQGDVIEVIKHHGPWNFIGLHPPCTCISLSGNSTYGEGMPKHELRLEAIAWTEKLWIVAKGSAEFVYLENPVGTLRRYSDAFPKPQYIQPWQFGHAEQKKTGLWLHNLPDLKQTDNVYDEMMNLPKNKRGRIHYMPPSANRGKIRSKTYPGIATALAEQYSKLQKVKNNY